MKTKTQIILSTMHVVFWVMFIGMCIRTGAMLISFFISLSVNHEAAKNLYMDFNLSGIYNFGLMHYILFTSIVIAIAVIKACIAYLVIKILLQLNVGKPFSKNISELITRISHVALAGGLVAMIASIYAKWLAKHEVLVADNYGSYEFLFLAGVIYIIAQIFKKGIEIQSENELTV